MTKVPPVHLNTCLPIKKHRPLHRTPTKRRPVNSDQRTTESRARARAHWSARRPRTHFSARPTRQEHAGRVLNHPYPTREALRTRWIGLRHDHATPPRPPPSRRRIDNEHEASTFRAGAGDGVPEAPTSGRRKTPTKQAAAQPTMVPRTHLRTSIARRRTLMTRL